MRWLQLICVLIAGLSILTATNADSPKNKRDLSLVKKLIRLAIFGRENKTSAAPIHVNNDEDFRILRFPGYGNVLVQEIPKTTEVVIPENLEVIPINVADQRVSLAASYLGTHSDAETFEALRRIKALLHSGILSAKKDVQGIVPISHVAPQVELVDIGDQIVDRPHTLFDSSTICDKTQVIQRPIFERHPLWSIFHRPITFPNVLKPVPARLPVLPTRYSYKQIHGDGRVTTYTSNDNQNVEVTESDRPVPLPPFVTYRIQEAMNIGTKKPYLGPLKVNYPPTRSSSKYFYKQIHKDGTATSYSADMKGDVIVSQTDKVPILPGFISDRIEKVAAAAFTGKQPNVDVLVRPNVGQTYYYNQRIDGTYGNPMIDILGGVQVKVDSKEQQKPDVVSKSTYSYQTIHNDGSGINHLNEPSGLQTPVPRVEAKPISPMFTQNRLESITQANGGSFSYKIIHSDGSVTNYGIFGVHAGVDGENKIVPLDKTTPSLQAVSPNLNQEGPGSSFNYKIIHNDGSVSSYSNSSVYEEKGPSNPPNGNNEKEIIPSQNAKAYEQVSLLPNASPLSDSFGNKNIHTDGVLAIISDNEVKNGQTDLKDQSRDQNQVTLNDNKIVPPGTFSYKTIHSDGSVTNYPGDSGEFIKVSNNNAIKDTENFDDAKLHTNLQSTEKYFSLHPEVDLKSNNEYTGSTEIIPPAPMLQEIASNVLTDSPPSILIADFDKLLLTKPIVSSYTYKQINHNNPDQFTVAVNIGEAASKVPNPVATSSQINNGASVDTISKDYVYIPPATPNELLPIEVPKAVPIGEKNPPSAVVLEPVEDVTCVEKLSEHPIVVLDEPMKYSYEQRKVDGSAMIVESDQNVVSVTISPKEDYGKRGDIP